MLLASPQHTNLEQRFATLQWVRLATAALAVGAAGAVPHQLGLTLGQVLPISLGYLVLFLAGQAVDNERWKRGAWGKTSRGRAAGSPAESLRGVGARMGAAGAENPGTAVSEEAFSTPASARRRTLAPLQQILLPVDSLYLAVLLVPSGGVESDLILLFAVQLVAVTLLASPRTGVRVAAWDTALLIALAVLALGGPAAQFLGVTQLSKPPLASVAVRIAGFWVITLSTAYFSALSERELRRSKAQLDALTTMASEMERVVEASKGPEEIARILLRSVLEAFGFRQGAIVWERRGRGYAIEVPPGSEGLLAARPVRSLPKGALSGAVAGRAMDSGTALLVRHLSPTGDPTLDSLLPEATNVVVIPLRAGRERLGVLACEAGPPPTRRISRRSLEMASRFADHASLTLNNADLNAEVARLAASDALTGLANRREFTAVLAREVARTARTKEPLSLAVFDVDHFKAVNDTFGHLVGDEVLRQVATAMASQVREVDLVARYGGEEFAIILPNCAAADALVVVERVRAAVASADTVTRITVSAGIASLPGGANGEEGLMASADGALYDAKRAGRDRAVLANQPLAAPSPALLG